MASIKSNVIANYLGGGWTALMSLLFVPVYIHYLGIESYGLIGVFTMLQVWLFMLDAGLTPTLSREMARFKGGAHTVEGIHELLKALEWGFVIIAISIILIVYFISPWLANDWLRLDKLSPKVVETALAVTGLVISFRWVGSLYRSAINGLQNQIALNVLVALFATFRGLGVVFVLKYISPTIQAFFAYQAALAFVEMVMLRIVLYHFLPISNSKIALNFKVLKDIRKFAAGMVAITFLATVLTQADKLILSKLMTLADFGHYVLASTVASGLFFMIQPISNSIRPRLAELVAANKWGQLADSYHKFSQVITVMVVPVALVIAAFSDHIMLLWTRDVELTNATTLFISILVIGNMLNGLMNGPYALQLAFGKTHFSVWTNLISVLVLIPTLWITVRLYGAVAASLVWVLLNISYFLIIVPVMHRSILDKDMWHWYWEDTLLPSISALVVITTLYLIVPAPSLSKPLTSALILIVSVVLSLLASIFATRHCRHQLYLFLNFFRPWISR